MVGRRGALYLDLSSMTQTSEETGQNAQMNLDNQENQMFNKLTNTLGITKAGKSGFEFNFFTWHLIFRWFASATAGILLAVGTKMLLNILIWTTDLTFNPLNWWFTCLLALGLTFYFALPDSVDSDTEGESELVVPPTKFVAQLLWFGFVVPVRLVTSRYPWSGKRLGFSHSTKVVKSFTDENGMIMAGQNPFAVWDNPDAEDKSKQRSYISAPCANNAKIDGSLSLILRVVEPQKVLDSDKPAYDLGQRARQEFRELTRRFVDTDIPALHSVLGNLFKGETIVTCFVGKAIAGHKKGSMVRDTANEAMFELVDSENGDTIELAEVRLKDRLEREGDVDMIKSAAQEKLPDGTPEGTYVLKPTVFKLTNPIEEVLKDIGCELERVSFADIVFSDPVQTAANKASAEADERTAQLASAKTIKAARKELMPDADEVNNPGYELATVLAAAADDKSGNIRVVMVPGSGGNSLAGGLIAAGTQIGGNQ